MPLATRVIECDGQLPQISTTKIPMSSKAEHIKRPPNAYIIWQKDQRSKLQAQYPQMLNNELSKLLGVQWKAMSTEEKAPFEAEAIRRKEEHLRAYPNYKYVPRRKPKNVSQDSVEHKEQLIYPQHVPLVPLNQKAHSNFQSSQDDMRSLSNGSSGSSPPSLSPPASEPAGVSSGVDYFFDNYLPQYQTFAKPTETINDENTCPTIKTEPIEEIPESSAEQPPYPQLYAAPPSPMFLVYPQYASLLQQIALNGTSNLHSQPSTYQPPAQSNVQPDPSAYGEYSYNPL